MKPDDLDVDKKQRIQFKKESGNTSRCDLSVQNLSKKYGRAKRYALEDVSFQLHPGSITGVLGHNGAGKSTLLGSIVGGVKTQSGCVLYDGQDLTKNPKRAREICAFMPQSYVPLTGVSPREALTSVTGMRGFSREEGERHVSDFLQALSIEEYANTPGEKLSGGYHRLISLGMAMVQRARVYLLDEPTNDVDPIRRRLLWKMLRDTADRGAIVLVVTHNLEEIQSVADRLLVFDEGHLVKVATPAQLSALSQDTYFRVKDSYPGEKLNALPIKQIERAGNDITFHCDSAFSSLVISELSRSFADDYSLSFSVSRGTIQHAYEQLVGKEKTA